VSRRARVSDISRGAGLSHGSLHHEFDSKEQIVREAAEAQERLLTEPSQHGVDAVAASPRERIRRPQAECAAASDVDPALAAMALGAMVARFAGL
jgi:AcrR family transcriptional regulator